MLQSLPTTSRWPSATCKPAWRSGAICWVCHCMRSGTPARILPAGDLWLCLSFDETRDFVPPNESDYTHYAFSVAPADF